MLGWEMPQQAQLPRSMPEDEGTPHVDNSVWHAVGNQRAFRGKQDLHLHRLLGCCVSSLGEQIKQQVAEALGQHRIEAALDRRFFKYTDAIALSCEKLQRALDCVERDGEIGGNCHAATPAQDGDQYSGKKQGSALPANQVSEMGLTLELQQEEQHIVRSEWLESKPASPKSPKSALKSSSISGYSNSVSVPRDSTTEFKGIGHVTGAINAMKDKLHLATAHKMEPSFDCALSDTSSFHLPTVNKLRAKQTIRLKRSVTVTRLCWAPKSKALKVFANGYIFNTWCSTMTVAFAIAVGVDTHYHVRAAVEGWQNPKWIGDIVFCFSCWFVLEVTFRIAVNGYEYFLGNAWRWNLFDTILVGVSIADHVILSLSGGQSVGAFRVFRMFKVLRALRVVRVLRIFDELRLMVSSILTSIASLMWSLVFLFIITYLASIAFLQGAIQYFSDPHSDDPKVHAQLKRFYGGMPDAIYSLMGCITGGYDWNEPAEPLWSMGSLYGMIFMIFVLVSILGVLNVVTGVFVERATRISKIDRDYAISEHLRSLELDVHDCMVLFQEIDVEGKGAVEADELMEFLSTERAKGYFSILGIDTTQRKTLVRILDIDRDGWITVEEFVGGCIALRGEAKKADIVQLMLEVRQLKEVVKQMDQNIPR